MKDDCNAMVFGKVQGVSELVSKSAYLSPSFHKIFHIQQHIAKCEGTQELLEKYGSPTNNVQRIVSVTNLRTTEVVWFNTERKRKPQSFKKAYNMDFEDPTGGGGLDRCDFCNYTKLTASDPFGRIESTFAVTASNLFKYVAPYQAVVLFKHHNPLTFNQRELGDLLKVSHQWFQSAQIYHKLDLHDNDDNSDQILPCPQLYPLFVWNCLPRAGASQYHGHAQVMMSSVKMPVHHRGEDNAYWQDFLMAHDSIGLTKKRESREDGTTATMFASICPLKDCETYIYGESLDSAAFADLLYVALRTIIDEFGSNSFNVGIFERGLIGESESMNGPIVARVVSRGRSGSSSVASDWGGLEVFGDSSIGSTDPFTVYDSLCSTIDSIT